MKCREFVYTGGHVPNLTEREHGAFLLQLQKAILASLEKRELLNQTQYNLCIEELERRYCEKAFIKPNSQIK